MPADIYELLEAEYIDYQQPLSVLLRKCMKEDFLRTLAKQPEALKYTVFEGGSIVIYGTTLMTIADSEGVKFPYVGQKAGDIDLYIEPAADASSRLRDADYFDREYKKVMGPLMQHVIDECGFTLLKDKFHPEAANGSMVFSKPFGVERHFPAEEIRAILQERGIEMEIPPEGKTVSMELDLVSSPPLSPLSPIESDFFKDAKTSIRIDNWYHLLAKKITRSAQQGKKDSPLFQHSNDPNGFKPRDLIDIYNILNADPRLVDLSRPEDLGLIRTLCLAYFARFDQTQIAFDLQNFEPMPENITAFRQALDRRLSHEEELSDERIKDIFSAYSSLVQKIFPEVQQAEARQGLKLQDPERDFLTEIRGFRHLPSGETRQVEPSISTRYLEELYPAAFAAHPELSNRLRNHPTLCGIKDSISSRRMDVADF